MSTPLKIMYSMRGLDSFATEAIERLRRFPELLHVIAHFLKVDRKSISAWLPLSMRILESSHLSM
jgi:hypothetical protein